MFSGILDPTHYILNSYTFGPLVVGILVLALGITVLIQERTSHASFVFALFSLSVSIWLLSSAAMTAALVDRLALGWGKIKNGGVAFIPAMTFIFTLTVIRQFRAFRPYVFLSLFVSAVFCVGIIATDLFITDVYHYPWGYYPKYTHLSLWLVTYFTLMVLLCIALFGIEYRRSESKIQKRRLKTFFLAFLIGSLAGVDFIAAFGYPLYPFGYVPVLIFLFITAQTVLRFRLLDITPSFAASKIVNTMSDALVVFDHEKVIRFINQAAAELFQPGLVGKPITAIEGGLLSKSQLRNVLEGHNFRGLEGIHRNRFGQEMILNISASVILDRSQKPAAVICLVRDVTEYKRLEREREEQAKQLEITNRELLDRERVMMSLLEDLQTSQQSLAQLAAVVQFSDDAIFSKTIDGIITSWNHGAELSYGYSLKEVIGRSVSIIIPPDKIHELSEIMDKVKRGHRVHQYETVRITKEGKWIDVSITVSPMRDSNHQIIGASTIARDITEQKKIQDQLKMSEEYSRMIIETASDAFIGMDSNGLITDWNKQAETIFGWKREEVLGKLLAEIMIPERYRQAHQDGLKRFLTKGEGPVLNKRIEMSGLRKGGSEFSCELIIWPVKRKESFIFNAFVHDITERKRAQQELLGKAAELARLTAEREQAELFAFAASHDLQEPLSKIISFGDLLKIQSQEKLDDKCNDYIARMQSAAARMSQLIDSLLRFSRVATKGESFNSVDLEKVINEVVSDLEFKIAESKSAVSVGKLPEIRGDWHQIYDVFQNLITNSIKFRKQGRPHEIKISSKPLNQGQVEISVVDNGIGFEQKYADKLFRPFERLHSRSEYEGSGMGLAICQKILLRHGGTIQAQGRPGEGAVFKIRLPVNQEQKV